MGAAIKKNEAGASFFFVRINGLEPLLLSELDPKSSAATNYAISASEFEFAKVRHFFELEARKMNFGQKIVINTYFGDKKKRAQGFV